MMSIVVYIAIGIGFLAFFTNVFYGPFMIGKELGKYTAVSYLIGILKADAWLIISGNVLGWW